MNGIDFGGQEGLEARAFVASESEGHKGFCGFGVVKVLCWRALGIRALGF